MPKKSAGILLFRLTKNKPEVMLAHPGGPFWKKKEENAWSVPKGEFEDDETPLDAAKREFHEETNLTLKNQNFFQLQPVKRKDGKTVIAFALEEDIDITEIKSNNFSMEWPPKSGKLSEFPEIDRCEWFDLQTARLKINNYQIPLIDELETIICKL
ncbi:MAG: NUDIX domain-containing protein [Bacteroidia bacterium]|nr:NUDIX domain-containing protein [Bacteroidia bacterium]